MVIAAMASMPDRVSYLEQVVAALRPQVDLIRVYLNNYSEVPDFLGTEEGILSEDALGDLGDAGKFYWIGRSSGFDYSHYLTVDDDIGYPIDYVSRLIYECELREGNAIVGVHGSHFSFPIHDFVQSRGARFRFHESLARAESVHILGTGTTLFHRDTLDLSLFDFRMRNAGDIQLAIIAQRHHIPLVVIPRPENWLIELRPWTAPGYSIWKETKATSHTLVQTHLCNTLDSWQLHDDPVSEILEQRENLSLSVTNNGSTG